MGAIMPNAMALVGEYSPRRSRVTIMNKSDLNPGYVKGYVPGVRRKRRAVHTRRNLDRHGVRRRRRCRATWELFHLINPIRHGDGEAAIRKYKVEPYVVAADVYANPQHAGRGGWTWYTGSAGWMYRLITESLLGIHLETDRLRFAPCLPAEWKTSRSTIVSARPSTTSRSTTAAVVTPSTASLQMALNIPAQPWN